MITIGRNNLALTIYVPYDCGNNCKFCPSKAMYKKYKMAELESLKESIKQLAASKEIKDVVFTGGEPQYNIEVLKELIDVIPSSKNIYINTTLPEKNVFEFIELVNKTNSIKGVNISRHDISIEEDRKILNNVCTDDIIKFFKKPVKINVVLANAINSVAFEVGLENYILQVCKRWASFKDLTVCFREDYTKMEEQYLHQIKTETSKIFLNNMEYKGHSFCEVCDTLYFNYDGSLDENNNEDLTVAYHRGLEKSCVEIDKNSMIINDIIVFPDGTIGYDWDKKVSKIDEVLDILKVKNITVESTSGKVTIEKRKSRSSSTPSSSSSSSYSASSGASRSFISSCGGFGRSC